MSLENGLWTQAPELLEARWRFGLCVVAGKLFAVGGCGQLDSIESLDLDKILINGRTRPGDVFQEARRVEGWQRCSPMRTRRHMPGVTAARGRYIYVIGKNIIDYLFFNFFEYDGTSQVSFYLLNITFLLRGDVYSHFPCWHITMGNSVSTLLDSGRRLYFLSLLLYVKGDGEKLRAQSTK